jgi:hypothetical protein
MNYQGYLTDNGGDPLGDGASENRDVTFRFWNNPTNVADENRLYSESHTVTILDGNFSVLLGNGTPVADEANAVASFNELFDHAVLFLGLTVDDGDSGTTDAEITPRQQLVSTAFAFRAAVAERVDAQAITNDQIASDAITKSKIAAEAVGQSEIKNDAVGTNEIIAGAVTESKIATDAVTENKIATGAVTSDEIAANSVGTSELQDGAVLVENLGYDSVRADGANLLIVSGVVEFPADVQLNDKIYGPGYWAQYEGDGKYEVNWDTTFSAPPAVTATQLHNGETSGELGIDDNVLIISYLSPSYCKIHIRDTTTKNLEHDKFCFIVIGPK